MQNRAWDDVSDADRKVALERYQALRRYLAAQPVHVLRTDQRRPGSHSALCVPNVGSFDAVLEVLSAPSSVRWSVLDTKTVLVDVKLWKAPTLADFVGWVKRSCSTCLTAQNHLVPGVDPALKGPAAVVFVVSGTEGHWDVAISVPSLRAWNNSGRPEGVDDLPPLLWRAHSGVPNAVELWLRRLRLETHAVWHAVCAAASAGADSTGREFITIADAAPIFPDQTSRQLKKRVLATGGSVVKRKCVKRGQGVRISQDSCLLVDVAGLPESPPPFRLFASHWNTLLLSSRRCL
jgi:hypothetical protein